MIVGIQTASDEDKTGVLASKLLFSFYSAQNRTSKAGESGAAMLSCNKYMSGVGEIVDCISFKSVSAVIQHNRFNVVRVQL